MSNVPKSRRKATRFETQHNLIKLRDEITKICVQDFGFSYEKCKARRDNYMQQFQKLSNIDDIMKRYDTKLESFNRWFIDKECEVILDMIREITKEFTLGNSIYPDGPAIFYEYIKRRKHMSTCIGSCYALKQELQYVLRILPVDINKYKPISRLIDKQINLIKGVRRADNRFVSALNLTSNITYTCPHLI